MPDDIRICAECDEEIRVIGWGDELLDYCESCNQFEPCYRYVTSEEYEKLMNGSSYNPAKT